MSINKITLTGKTAIVTGANTGIGYETALDFASRGARVILACRNQKLADEAKQKIVKISKNDNVVVKIVDFSSLNSVRAFAHDINETEPRLDILVNNAGAAKLGNHETEDGLHILMQVNHFGPFLLTNLLLGLLKKSAPSRIVNVSSEAAKFANLDPEKLNQPSGGGISAKMVGIDYANSKLCNILMSNELAVQLAGSGVVSNSLHPGRVKTEITRNLSGISIKIVNTLASAFFLTPKEGAQTQIYCALSEEMGSVTGEYLENSKIVNMPKTVKPGLARQVWRKSEELVKWVAEENQI